MIVSRCFFPFLSDGSICGTPIRVETHVHGPISEIYCTIKSRASKKKGRCLSKTNACFGDTKKMGIVDITNNPLTPEGYSGRIACISLRLSDGTNTFYATKPYARTLGIYCKSKH